ncbi:flagellar transcriptional regulator FlhD, partial [Mycobacterium tuberculosis]|nr:flagellar transcriptional regulator FlhD [Mycobacterium tuberculosis]
MRSAFPESPANDITMEATSLLSEIRSLNIAYLRLARRLLATDQALATTALGIS